MTSYGPLLLILGRIGRCAAAAPLRRAARALLGRPGNAPTSDRVRSLATQGKVPICSVSMIRRLTATGQWFSTTMFFGPVHSFKT